MRFITLLGNVTYYFGSKLLLGIVVFDKVNRSLGSLPEFFYYRVLCLLFHLNIMDISV